MPPNRCGRARGWHLLACITSAVLAGCGGGGGDSPGVTPPPANTNGPPSTAVSALEDAAARLAPTLGSCSSRVTTDLATLRAVMSPFLNATRADVDRVRTALTACTDVGVEADRDALGLALDVAIDVLAAAGR
ncbi:MAG: hypothetical protein IPP20_21610 [Gemmatimonadetes bacterium]|nr:hypothetical protein [Gemmatimonadota bacterium]